jgi:hypothetical protein
MIRNDGVVIEYDGMKRNGRFAVVISASRLSPAIIDLSGTESQAIGVGGDESVIIAASEHTLLIPIEEVDDLMRGEGAK